VAGALVAVHEDVSGRRYVGPPTGGRGRTIDLPPLLAEHLIEHIAATGEWDLLFPDRHGQPRGHSSWLYLWLKACDGRPARLDASGRVIRPALSPAHLGLRFQDLRHTHKTMLIELGVPDVL
jgi:integrase